MYKCIKQFDLNKCKFAFREGSFLFTVYYSNANKYLQMSLLTRFSFVARIM